MIPLRDVIPSRSTPYVTLTLIVLSALVWLIELALPRDGLAQVFQVYGVVPAQFRSPTLLTALLLHASWVHAVVNMWGLWIFGENVERQLGHLAFGVFYAICGAVAPLGHVAVDALSPLPAVGAGSAVAGVMGAYLVLYPRSRVLALAPFVVSWDLVELPAAAIIGVWFLLQLVGYGALVPAVHTHDPVVAFATDVVACLVGALSLIVLGKRRPAIEWR